MAIPLRHASALNIVANDRTFFVTSSTWGKRNLQSSRMAELFIEVLYNYREQHKFLLHDFVVMPDHFHILLTVQQDMSIERAVQLIKGGFAFCATHKLGLSAPIWQKGFSEVRVLDFDALLEIRRYIRSNPVAKQLAQEASAYPCSSANSKYQLDPEPQRLKPSRCERSIGAPKVAP